MDQGLRAHPSASLRDRAGAPAGLSPQAVSGKAARHIAQALRDYRGVGLAALVALLVLFA